MREILFRGKRKGDNKWVYGSFARYNLEDGTADMFLPEYGVLFSVHIDTLGQFTGLTDKNGKKIFEGDIVHILGDPMVNDWKDVDYNALIAFLDGGFCALDGTVEDYGFRRYALERMDFSLEVIGSIHDNPELMEV